jgi:hypothetical protein
MTAATEQTAVTTEREPAEQIDQAVRYTLTGWFNEHCPRGLACGRYDGALEMDVFGASLVDDRITLHAYRIFDLTEPIRGLFNPCWFAEIPLRKIVGADPKGGEHLSLDLRNGDRLELWPARGEQAAEGRSSKSARTAPLRAAALRATDRRARALRDVAGGRVHPPATASGRTIESDR